MHDGRLMRDVRNHKGALQYTVEVSASRSYLRRHEAHYYHVNQPLKICECESVIVLAKKLLLR